MPTPKHSRRLAQRPQRLRVVSLSFGTAVVLLWTVIRHISNGVNFDVVGQIGLAQQWAHGQTAGAQLGTTNYLLKTPVYYLVNKWGFLTPMNRLLVLAVIFNIVTFILLFVLYEKIMALYKVKDRSWFYIAMMWLATIAGGVYWLDYANSRNLETVGGVGFIYLVLKFIKTKRLTLLMTIGAVGSIVFFADSLQVYVCGAGVCLYALLGLRQRTKAATLEATSLIGVTLASYLVARGLMLLTRTYLHLTFLAASHSHLALTSSSITQAGRATVFSTLQIFNADFLKPPLGLNSLREALNAFVVAIIVAALLTLPKKSYNPAAYGLLVLVVAANYVVYVASGQALQSGTARYLIMVPLFTLLLVALSGDKLTGRYKRKLQAGWLLIIAVSSLMLLGALVINWPHRHAKDAHIQTTITFMQQHHFVYALSSRDVGVTTTYFAQGRLTVLPMACAADHTLQPTSLFYDEAAFRGLYSYHQEVPILLPAAGISFGTKVCTKASIIAQFGLPKRELAIPNIGIAMVYDADSLRITAIDKLVGHPRPPKPVLHAALPDPPAGQATTLHQLVGCTHGTVDVVVAHPDDDILFMNPDLADQLAAHTCVRTTYVTAADDGRSPIYWTSREQGIEAAYALMLGTKNEWTDSTVAMDQHPILVRTLTGYPSVSLMFLRLPDGGVNGRGFGQTNHASLEALAAGTIPTISAVDGSTSYTYSELAQLLRHVIMTDRPDMIFTHVTSNPATVGDHSDHTAVGKLTLIAAVLAKSTAGISGYIGYPANNLPVNLSVQATAQKRAIFYAYANDDNVICRSAAKCSIDATYGKYFARSYKLEQVQPTPQTSQAPAVSPPKGGLVPPPKTNFNTAQNPYAQPQR